MSPTKNEDNQILIAGVDEAGRGPLAGPVVAAAVVFRDGYINSEIRDSKKLSAQKRDYLFEIVKRDAIAWKIVAIGPKRIDTINIREATKLAMNIAVSKIHADLVLIDGNMSIDTHLNQKTVVKGDAKHVEIAAASILAKVWRDHLMKKLNKKYPGYNFDKHAGYPTKAHKIAISELGPSKIHRRTFRGVKEFC